MVAHLHAAGTATRGIVLQGDVIVHIQYGVSVNRKQRTVDVRCDSIKGQRFGIILCTQIQYGGAISTKDVILRADESMAFAQNGRGVFGKSEFIVQGDIVLQLDLIAAAVGVVDRIHCIAELFGGRDFKGLQDSSVFIVQLLRNGC